MNSDQNTKIADELFQALLEVKNKREMERFMKDLCTPQEIATLAERWRVCKLLGHGELSYREISAMTGASLATITRVSRFLKDEPHQGYKAILDRMNTQRKNKTTIKSR